MNNQPRNGTPPTSALQNSDIGPLEDTSIRQLTVTTDRLPAAHKLTRDDVINLALRLAATNQNTSHDAYRSKGKHYIDTDIYGIRIESDTKNGAIARTTCAKFWRTALERKVNLARLDFEAKHKLVGGPDQDCTEIYSSNATVEWMRAKTEASNLALSKMIVHNTITGESFSMLDVANASYTNRFNELYSFTKNFEAMASENGMVWIFGTATALPEFHPNPSNPNSKCTYNPELGLKASHLYISRAWQQIRALLSKRGIRASPTTYFGARTVEVHKDGCVHWHFLIFIKLDLIKLFTEICERKFPLPGQLKIVLGDDKKGKASSYIFKYLMKEFDTNTLDRNIMDRLTVSDSHHDEQREEMDLASIQHSERVRAAIRAMNIKQYQPIGVLRVTTLLRKINKLDLADMAEDNQSVLGFIRKNVWRNTLGLKNLLEKPQLFSPNTEKNPTIMLIKESVLSRYGEDRERVIGIEIDGQRFISKGTFVIKKHR